MNQILLADDERDVREELARILRDAGFDPLTASTGTRAVNLHREHAPQVAILDMRMPGKINGLQAARQIREQDHRTGVVAVTAYQHEYEPKDVDGLVHVWVAKPISSERRRAELVETVRGMVSRYNRQVLAEPLEGGAKIQIEHLVDELRTLSKELRATRESGRLRESQIHDLRLALVAIASGIAARDSGFSPEVFSGALLSEMQSAGRLVEELSSIRIANIAKAYKKDLQEMMRDVDES